MFQGLQKLPADPILGLIAAFREDAREFKVDLGVGVYKDEDGNTPILQSIQAAQQLLIDTQTTKSYVGPAGNPLFNDAMTQLLLGDSACIEEKRVAKVQTPGGCGALRVAAELVNVMNPGANIWVSDPTWANHIPLLGNCGLNIKTYPYYDVENARLDFAAMLERVALMERGDLILLHGSCHNPSGADLTFEQWQTLCSELQKKGVVPFIDVAYQGFGVGIESDVAGLRYMVQQLPEVIVAASCSKNFGLYRERVGLALVVCEQPATVAAAESHMLSIVRGIYSMPPDYGAALVANVLTNKKLYIQWQDEVRTMRERINGLRSQFTQLINERIESNQFDFVAHQHGMFSFLGLTPAQILRLKEEFGIYMLHTSRASIAGLNQKNIDYVCDSIAQVHSPEKHVAALQD